MRMQVILDSSFARPGSALICGGKKGEFRDWTTRQYVALHAPVTILPSSTRHPPGLLLTSIQRGVVHTNRHLTHRSNMLI